MVSTTSTYIKLNYKPNIYIYIYNLFFVVFSIEVAISCVITVASTASLNKSFRLRTTTVHSGRVSNSTLFSDPSSPGDETFALRVTITFELSFPGRGRCILRYNTVAYPGIQLPIISITIVIRSSPRCAKIRVQ